jgi:sugar/nucleoside kinase (ribokinase family)
VTYRKDMPDDYRSFFAIDSFAGRVVDAVGAGDALLSYATLSMVATKNEVIAAILGNMAAGIECEHEGNIPVTPEMVLNKIDAVEKIARYGA